MSTDLDRSITGALAVLVDDTPPLGKPPTSMTTNGHTSSSNRRVLAATAAVLLVAAGTVGLVVAQRVSDPPTAAMQYAAATDPTAHLFVLPTDLDGLELSNGESYTARPDEDETQGATSSVIVMGTKTDSGFSDLFDARMLDAVPAGFGDSEWTEVDTPNGPALVSTGLVPNYAVAQQRGDGWLLLTGATGDQDLLDVLPLVQIDSSGTPTIQDPQRVVIEEITQDSTLASYSTSYDMKELATGITFEVETATFPSAVVLGTYTPNPITQTTVNGTPAWILNQGDDSTEDIQTGIAWRATPNRIVTVGARATPDEVRAMAERLQQVTEEEWLNALPGASIQN
jgi:hypothetical protein